MTAVQEAPDITPVDGPCKEGCLLCTTSSSANAYRPHTLNPDCWCTNGKDGKRLLLNCVFERWL